MIESLSVPHRVILAADVGIDRASYESLELAMALILEDPSHTLAVRLLAMHSLHAGAVAQYGRGNSATACFSDWMAQMNSSIGQHWIYQEAANMGPGRESRQRLALAPMIAAAESAGSAEDLRESPLGVSSMARAIHAGRGRVRLPSLGGEIVLEQMSHIWLDQDSPALSPVLVGHLTGWLRARLLLSLPNLVKGTRYLLLCAALTRWYAAAAAAIQGREEVGEAELLSAAQVVEREYIAGSRPRDLPTRQPVLAGLFGLLLDLLVSPADLVHNPYAPHHPAD